MYVAMSHEHMYKCIDVLYIAITIDIEFLCWTLVVDQFLRTTINKSRDTKGTNDFK